LLDITDRNDLVAGRCEARNAPPIIKEVTLGGTGSGVFVVGNERAVDAPCSAGGVVGSMLSLSNPSLSIH